MLQRHHYHNNCDHNFCKVSDIQKTLLHNHCKQKQTIQTELSITFLLNESHLSRNSCCNQHAQDCSSMVCR